MGFNLVYGGINPIALAAYAAENNISQTNWKLQGEWSWCCPPLKKSHSLYQRKLQHYQLYTKYLIITKIMGKPR